MAVNINEMDMVELLNYSEKLHKSNKLTPDKIVAIRKRKLQLIASNKANKTSAFTGISEVIRNKKNTDRHIRNHEKRILREVNHNTAKKPLYCGVKERIFTGEEGGK